MRFRSLATPIYLLLGSCLLVACGASAFLTVQVGQVAARYNDLLSQNVAQADKARLLQLTFKKQVQEWKDILLRGSDPEMLAKYDKNFHARSADVDRLAQEIADGSSDQQIRDVAKNFLEEHGRMNSAYGTALTAFKADEKKNAHTPDAAVKGIDRGPTDSLDKIVERTANLVAEAQKLESERVASSQRFTVLLLLLSGGALSVAGVLLVRSISRRLKSSLDTVQLVAAGDLTHTVDAGDSKDEIAVLMNCIEEMRNSLSSTIMAVIDMSSRIASASHEIASATDQMERAAGAQTDQAAQISTAMHEISATVDEIASSCQSASESAQSASGTAQSGGNAVTRNIQTMEAVAAASLAAAEKVAELGNRSTEIGKIVAVIDDIADQTNLLALNAAIEAARAGEQGRGFAVVADEVRKLAERTSAATREIAATIGRVQTETETAVASMKSSTTLVDSGLKDTRSAGDQLHTIILMADEVQQRIAQIATAAHEHSSATSEVTAGVARVTALANENGTALRESAQACAGLSSMAAEMEELVNRFKVATARHSQRSQYGESFDVSPSLLSQRQTHRSSARLQ
jgi:methyl-accepting chemotaxis protein